MKEEGIIKVEERAHASGAANERLRKDGYLPGNIYGKEIGSIPISLKKEDLEKHIVKFGRNAVFKLDIDDEKKYNVVLREIQYSPVLKRYLHVEFQKINLSEETETDISIKLIGKEQLEAKKLLLLQQMDAITVKGLPRKMPESIEIDVSNLKAGDIFTVGSIEFPKGITSDLAPEHIVLVVNESFIEETLEEAVEETAEETNVEKE